METNELKPNEQIMLANPKIGTKVLIRYKKSLADWMPLHNKTGIVAIASKGKPRNHGVMVDGVLWVVPCGNLNKLEESAT